VADRLIVAGPPAGSTVISSSRNRGNNRANRHPRLAQRRPREPRPAWQGAPAHPDSRQDGHRAICARRRHRTDSSPTLRISGPLRPGKRPARRGKECPTRSSQRKNETRLESWKPLFAHLPRLVVIVQPRRKKALQSENPGRPGGRQARSRDVCSMQPDFPRTRAGSILLNLD